MNNRERLFYITLLLIQAFFVIHIYRKANNVIFREINFKSTGKPFVYSFKGKLDGQEIEVLFTAYNPNWYLFLIVSPECPHCKNLLNFFQENFSNFPFSKADSLQIFVLSSREIKKEKNSLPLILIKEKDIAQFGYKFPSIYLVNGKGEILFKTSGFADNERFKQALIESIWTAYKKDKFKKAEKVI